MVHAALQANVNKEWPPMDEQGRRPFPTNYYFVIHWLSFLGRPPVPLVRSASGCSK